MSSIKYPFYSLLVLIFALTLSTHGMAEEEDKTQEVQELTPSQQTTPLTQQQSNSSVRKEKKDKRYFGTEKDPRIDAGVFHVAFAAGGNFFMEPKLVATTKAPTGEYFNDFGFGGGVVFDYDYSQMTENIPLMLRGYVGYKYVLNSVHVFDVEGIARRMWQFSDTTSFGVGAGVSTAVWYRTQTDTSPYEETHFLPSLVLETGFEFNPVMVQLKWLVNRLGSDSSINGVEFLVGVRL